MHGLVHPGARRLPLVPRARRVRASRSSTRKPYVTAERVHERRPEDRPARRTTSRTSPRSGKRVDVLPVALGREGLAAGRVQPEDAASSTSRPTRTSAASWRASDAEYQPRPALHGLAAAGEADLTVAAGRDAHRRAPSLERRRRASEALDARVRVAELGTGARDRRRPACSTAARTTATSARSTPTTGKQLWQYRTNSGITGVPTTLRGRRRAVRRGAVGLGRRRAGHARCGSTEDRAAPRRRAAGRRGLGVRAARALTGDRSPQGAPGAFLLARQKHGPR